MAQDGGLGTETEPIARRGRQEQDAYRLHLQTGQGRTAETTKTYLGHLSRYSKWCEERQLPFAQGTQTQVFEHISEMAGHVSMSYINTRIAVLKSYYKWVMMEGRRRGNPAKDLRMRKEKQEPKPPFTDAQLRRLLKAATGNLRDTAILLMFIGGGLRRSELLGMKVEHLDMLRGTVLLKGKGSKERLIAPGRAAMNATWQYVGARRKGHIWRGEIGRPLTKTGLYRIFERLSREARVDKVFPHRFRTTAICNLLDAGADLIAVSVIAGHEHLDTTRRYQRAKERDRALFQQRRFSPADRLASHSVVARLLPSGREKAALKQLEAELEEAERNAPGSRAGSGRAAAPDGPKKRDMVGRRSA